MLVPRKRDAARRPILLRDRDRGGGVQIGERVAAHRFRQHGIVALVAEVQLNEVRGELRAGAGRDGHFQ